jgi:putative oxidoreductase
MAGDKKQIALVFLRTVLAGIMFIHGVTRISNGTVGGFGEFLTAQGFPLGFYLAWGITIFELVGSTALAVGFFAYIIALIFALHLATGIYLVHAKNGWFVVGAGTGGMEYSVLLIAGFITIAISHYGRKI